MRSINVANVCGAGLVFLLLTACERTPYEKQVFEHARMQAELNAENFERAREVPVRAPLRSPFDCAVAGAAGMGTCVR